MNGCDIFFIDPGHTAAFPLHLGIIACLLLLGIIAVAVFLLNCLHPFDSSPTDFHCHHRTERILAMEPKLPLDISLKWELYTPQQQEALLAEFRRKFPRDYYSKTRLFEFLVEKLYGKGTTRANVAVNGDNNED